MDCNASIKIDQSLVDGRISYRRSRPPVQDLGAVKSSVPHACPKSILASLIYGRNWHFAHHALPLGRRRTGELSCMCNRACLMNGDEVWRYIICPTSWSRLCDTLHNHVAATCPICRYPMMLPRVVVVLHAWSASQIASL